jgi:N-acylneuraminate cytidylyltransferase
MPPRSAIAIILARAGSKGVPGKNVAPVAGKPCVRWTIEAALAARSVAAVLVSSDDPRVLDLASAMGCAALDRPAELASDSARIDDAARHALDRWSALAGAAVEPQRPIVILYANAPVRPEGLIDRAVDLLLRSGCDSVQSYAPVGKFHPWWTARLDEHGQVRPWQGEVLNHAVFRRQDLPPAHIPDGGVIACTARALRLLVPGVAPGPHAFFGLDRRGITNPEGAVVDIDSQVDLLVADALLRERARPGQIPA